MITLSEYLQNGVIFLAIEQMERLMEQPNLVTSRVLIWEMEQKG